MEIYRHAEYQSVYLVMLKLSTGSAFVVLAKHNGSLIPIEVRLSALNPADFVIHDWDRLSQLEPKDIKPTRINTSLLREISLSEVVATIRSKQGGTMHGTPPISDSIKTLHEFSLFLEPKRKDRNSGKTKVFKFVKKSGLDIRSVRDFDAAIARIEAAIIYVRELDNGSTQPIPKVAEELGVSTERARSLIAGARRDGYLSTTHKGTAGGALTEKVQEFWSIVMGEK